MVGCIGFMDYTKHPPYEREAPLMFYEYSFGYTVSGESPRTVSFDQDALFYAVQEFLHYVSSDIAELFDDGSGNTSVFDTATRERSALSIISVSEAVRANGEFFFHIGAKQYWLFRHDV